ncbi:MAG: UDP-N-acetylglucosamine 2-epimerase (non-hydrolyzing) [Desulfuromonadaceae bacterium]|nr:UDP-N-acetylglucosamine 2-epimerase (non-hydrolyzing) [Desulfuromonadaceae bacterium]MDD2849525.1 UDP-N-acetylglucosamine 2-epimerase (non-hydrolyzing) [Desulfuromonadaceae bacterium]MDD4131951.1 UDP-N-acetylglucosamine 2-epimerase (non-hydrolyzing) [Desulfuromonadaceae bacterium]
MKVLSVFGTRPEAIKMAPVINELERYPDLFESVVCVTAQQRQMLDQVLDLFKIHPQYDLNVMLPNQDLSDITSNVLLGLKHVICEVDPDIVLVHGDTTTSMVAAMAAYYHKKMIGHVEAGLRTYDKFAPFPEEMNRKVTAVLADVHFAPTETARQNLLKEGIAPESVFVTGNTVIDALIKISRLIDNDVEIRDSLNKRFAFLDCRKKLILVTGHRRENFGDGIRQICEALRDIAQSLPDVNILYPVHLNPHVQGPVRQILGEGENIFLVAPVDYLVFVYLMKRADLIITDSGGIQEEAPSLGKPVLVTRTATERPEAVKVGAVKLVGSDRMTIISEVLYLLNDANAYHKMSNTCNPFGDGTAADQIVFHLKHILKRKACLI